MVGGLQVGDARDRSTQGRPQVFVAEALTVEVLVGLVNQSELDEDQLWSSACRTK